MVLLMLVAIWATLASGEEKSYRLPRNVWPSLYELQIKTNIGENTSNFMFYGHVNIELDCVSSTKFITLHANALTILKNKTRVSSKNAGCMAIKSQQYDMTRGFFTVELTKPLKLNTTYVLSLIFEGVLGEGLAGLYRSSYKDRKSGQTRWLAVTQFEAIDARRAFPCFDEPEFKARFKISLVRVKDYSSFSNMPLLCSIPIKNQPGWVADHYQVTERMSTYLVAFIISDFVCRESTEHPNNVTFRVCARRDALEQTAFASKVGPQLLEYFKVYFNVTYPLPKQDMMAIPDFNAGAMENWGLITYREQLLLYDPRVSSATDKRNVASVISHELAHQWFGNLVTMRWWSDLWLNEGFATYVASLGLQYVNPEWNAMQYEAAESLIAVLASDALETSHPVSVKISHPSVIGQIFDAISYKKGGLLLRMMNMFMGEDVFTEGVHNYLHVYQYSNAKQDDLWHELTEVAHKRRTLAKNMTVKQVMDTWTLQKGYPLVTVTRDFETGKISIFQKRYLSYPNDHSKHPSENAKKDSPCWLIPISYTTQSDSDFGDTSPKLWLSCEQRSITFQDEAKCNEWIIFNIKASGIFRVNYDTNNWKMIQKTLNSDNFTKIGLMNRVQLIDDVMDLAWTGDVDYSNMLQLLGYLPREKQYLPWHTALSNINRLDLILRRTVGYGAFRVYLRKLLATTYRCLGDLANPMSNSYEETKLRNLIVTWACYLNFENCIEEARSLFKNWMESKESDKKMSIPQDFQSVVFCTAIKYGGEKEWEFAWQHYLHSNVDSEKMALLTSLSCTREAWLLKRFLEWSHINNSGIRRQDSYRVFARIAATDVGFPIAKEFLIKRIDDIHNYHKPKSITLLRYVEALAEKMYQEEELNEFQTFAKNNAKYLKESQLAVMQTTEKVQVNIQWHKKYYKIFTSYLESITE